MNTNLKMKHIQRVEELKRNEFYLLKRKGGLTLKNKLNITTSEIETKNFLLFLDSINSLDKIASISGGINYKTITIVLGEEEPSGFHFVIRMNNLNNMVINIYSEGIGVYLYHPKGTVDFQMSSFKELKGYILRNIF